MKIFLYSITLTLMSANSATAEYFVYFHLDKGIGEAYWNEERGASRAHTPIDGMLRRVGGVG